MTDQLPPSVTLKVLHLSKWFQKDMSQKLSLFPNPAVAPSVVEDGICSQPQFVPPPAAHAASAAAAAADRAAAATAAPAAVGVALAVAAHAAHGGGAGSDGRGPVAEGGRWRRAGHHQPV